jgi:hypothetical protein
MHDKLDELRAEHLRLRGQLVAEFKNLNDLAVRFRQEDDEYAAGLREAYRKGAQPPDDRRTPPEQRGLSAPPPRSAWGRPRRSSPISPTAWSTGSAGTNPNCSAA